MDIYQYAVSQLSGPYEKLAAVPRWKKDFRVGLQNAHDWHGTRDLKGILQAGGVHASTGAMNSGTKAHYGAGVYTTPHAPDPQYAVQGAVGIPRERLNALGREIVKVQPGGVQNYALTPTEHLALQPRDKVMLEAPADSSTRAMIRERRLSPVDAEYQGLGVAAGLGAIPSSDAESAAGTLHRLRARAGVKTSAYVDGPYEKIATFGHIAAGATVGGLAGAGYGWFSERDNPSEEVRRQAVIRGAKRGGVVGGLLGGLTPSAWGLREVAPAPKMEPPAPKMEPPRPGSEVLEHLADLTRRLEQARSQGQGAVGRAQYLSAHGPSEQDRAYVQQLMTDPNHTPRF